MTEPNRSCPQCRAVGHDSAGDHLFLMQDGKRWACSKNGQYHEPYFEEVGGSVQTFTEMISTVPAGFSEAVVPQQRAFPTMESVAKYGVDAIRGVPKDVVAFYGVKISFNEQTRDQIAHFYPLTSNGVVVSYHVRHLPKEFYHLHKRKELPEHMDLFGMSTMNITPNYLIITEGEVDAMAAFTMLAGMKKVTKLRVLSLPTGNNLAALQQNIALLKKARNLYLCPDQDEAGKKLIPEVWKILPDIKIMEFSEKDADDMQRIGKVDEFHEAFLRAERYKPASIVSSKALKVKAMQPVVAGLSYPFEALTKYTYGLRTRSLVGIGAGPGTGKTVLSQTLVMHIVYALSRSAAVFSLEEQPEDSLRRMAGHIMGVPIHLPNCQYDEIVLSQVLDSLDGRLFYYNHAGYRDWQDIEEVIRFLAYEGVQFFFIDPLSALHTHLGSSDSNQFLNKAMFQMSRMIHELDITIFHINHLNNPNSTLDHNEGAKVKASQFTGSRSQWRFSTDVWGLRRDATNPDPMIQNTTYFSILKNRLSGQLGEFPITYDHATGRLVEVPLSTSF